MKDNRWLVALLFIVLLLVGVLYLYLYSVNKSIPENSSAPYFPNAYSKFPNSKWRSNIFQPYYLGSFTNEKGWLILKTAYRASTGTVHYVNVFADGKVNANKNAFASFMERENETKILDKGAVRDHLFKFETGKQISITYLDTFQENASGDMAICSKIEQYCEIGTLADSQRLTIDTFSQNPEEILPENFILPALSISFDLLSK